MNGTLESLALFEHNTGSGCKFQVITPDLLAEARQPLTGTQSDTLTQQA